MRAPTFKLYDVFGLRPGCSLDDVKKAWRQAARRFHPDRNPDDPRAKERFAEASRAWDVLQDADRKAMYDEHGDIAVSMNFDPSLKHLKRSKPRAARNDYRPSGSRRRRRSPDDPTAFPGGWGGGPVTAEREPQQASNVRTGRVRPDDPSARRDAYQHSSVRTGQRATPGGPRPGSAPSSRPGSPMPRRGSDLKADAMIPLKTAALGGSWVLDVDRPELCSRCDGSGWRLAGRACTTCQGQGTVVRRATVTIQVPPDTQNNRVITTKGEGAPGINGGEPGDLWTTVKVAPDPHFERRGLDLWTEVLVPPEVAHLGGTVDVRNLHTVVTVEIPPNTVTGKIVRTKGAGIPGPRGRLPGDLHIRVRVQR